MRRSKGNDGRVRVTVRLPSEFLPMPALKSPPNRSNWSAGAVGAHAERDVNGLVAYQAFVADLDPQRVKENQRIDRLPRAGLPGRAPRR
jgi:hypothetical protein